MEFIGIYMALLALLWTVPVCLLLIDQTLRKSAALHFLIQLVYSTVLFLFAFEASGWDWLVYLLGLTGLTLLHFILIYIQVIIAFQKNRKQNAIVSEY